MSQALSYDLAHLIGATVLMAGFALLYQRRLFAPWGMAQPGAGPVGVLIGMAAFLLKLGTLSTALALFETAIAKMRVFRYADFLGGALLLGLLATIFLYVSEAV